MKLNLVRHAHAVAETDDPARPLSPKGRDISRELARWLRQHLLIEVSEVWHSPLLRAKETAEILVDELRLKTRMREMAGLEPDDDPSGVAAVLAKRTAPLMMVGHEPHLSALVGLLLGLDLARGAVEFKKGTVLCLERFVPGAPWVIAWLLPAKFVVQDE